MQIGTFRRHVGKTLSVRATKVALRTVTKNTARTQLTHTTVALKGHTGQLLQVLSQYLLGLQLTQEMKDDAFRVLGDIGYDVAALSRVLKVKLPSATRKSKLVGTRAAAILQVDSLATDLLRQVERGSFVSPTMMTMKKLVPMPQKGGAKEERDVDVVDQEALGAAETDRQTQMKSFLAGLVDVFWRLCYDLTGHPPVAVLEAKFARMQQEYPHIPFDLVVTPKSAVTPKAAPKKSPKAKAAAVPA